MGKGQPFLSYFKIITKSSQQAYKSAIHDTWFHTKFASIYHYIIQVVIATFVKNELEYICTIYSL